MHRSEHMPLLVVLVAFFHAACDAAGTDAREEACVVERVRKQLVQTRKSSVVEKYEKEDVDAANDVDNDEKKRKHVPMAHDGRKRLSPTLHSESEMCGW